MPVSLIAYLRRPPTRQDDVLWHSVALKAAVVYANEYEYVRKHVQEYGGRLSSERATEKKKELKDRSRTTSLFVRHLRGPDT